MDQESPHIHAVGGVVYRYVADGQLQLLLIKKQGGDWTLPKGQIKPDEDDLYALSREIREETALHGHVGPFVHEVCYPIVKKGQQQLKTVRYYLVQAAAGQPHPDRHEKITKVTWFPFKHALRRIQNDRVRDIAYQAIMLLNNELSDLATC